jgi:predicted transcriptional regulator
MMTRFRTLSALDPLGKAVDELLAGSQQDFPVMEQDRPIGILRRNDLVKALSEGRLSAAVEDAMCRECNAVDETDPLRRVVESMHARQCASVPVLREGQMIGLLTLDNVNEMILINSALEEYRPHPRPH